MFRTPRVLSYSLVIYILFLAINGASADEIANEQEIKSLLTLSLEELLNVKVMDVSVASGFKQKNIQAPAVISVITAQDIQASGANDLNEVLSWVPGLFVTPNSTFEHSYKIRGPGSALYGADAFAGVINIITKTADYIKVF